ncbi:hypothetical protein [Caulobacter sp.]|uniref:hypothetical protein n=1 Tax=Caulobacter sp. TaxID=78 RepID=UPI003BAEA665
MVTVLKAFAYAHDGMHVVNLAKGDVVEVRDDVFDGLFDAGNIDDGADIGAAVAAEITIPDGWETIQWFSLRALAASIRGGPVSDKRDAVAVITAELARREAA